MKPPPFYAKVVRKNVGEVFQRNVVGRRGATETTPRSPDLTPMNFSIWVLSIKEGICYKTTTNSRIERRYLQSFEEIDCNKQLCKHVRSSVLNRMTTCINGNGKIFEILCYK